jgi:hypothetical protein
MLIPPRIPSNNAPPAALEYLIKSLRVHPAALSLPAVWFKMLFIAIRPLVVGRLSMFSRPYLSYLLKLSFCISLFSTCQTLQKRADTTAMRC